MNSRFQTKMILLSSVLLLCSSQWGCATRTREVVTAGVVGAAVGAGLGYAVVHHGPARRHVVPNTIISSALLSLTFAGVTAYHYRTLDGQKISIASRMGRSYLLESDLQELGQPWELERQSISVRRDMIREEAISLDDSTSWVLPTFRRRLLPPEAGPEEFLSSRHTWEIVRPGFFLSTEHGQAEREAPK